jgi:hypothetical protein
MSRKEWLARAEAYDWAANHLEGTWPSDPIQQDQGLVAVGEIRKLAIECRKQADKHRE